MPIVSSDTRSINVLQGQQMLPAESSPVIAFTSRKQFAPPGSLLCGTIISEMKYWQY